MDLSGFICKKSKDKSKTFDQLANDVGMSVPLFIDALLGEKLMAPEKLEKLGKKLDLSKEDIDKMKDVHNKTNFDKVKKKK